MVLFDIKKINKKEIIILGELSAQFSEDEKVLSALNIKETYREPSFITSEKISQLSAENANLLFIICGSSKAFARWAKMLVSYGMNYGKEFVDFFLIKHSLKRLTSNKDKRLIVAYGNCQMHDYYDCLNRCPDFVNKYDSLYFKYEMYPRWKEEQIENILCIADVFIYTKESFDKQYRDLERFVAQNNPSCITFSIPCYSFRGIFPQTNPHIQEKNEFDIVQDIFNTFHREDIYVNKMIREQCNIDAIVGKYKSGTTFEHSTIERLFNLSLKQLAMMDRKSDIKVYDYVKDNITSHRLFKDPVHMEDKLVWHLSRQILELLDCNVPIHNIGGTIHYFSELPIYPEVAETLNLKWWNTEPMCELRLAEGMLLVSPEEYIERYCLFCENVCQIKKSLHINKEDSNRILELFCI